MRIKIGDLLVKAGVITDLQLRAALAEQQQWGGKLGDILVRMEFLTEEILVRALSKQTGLPLGIVEGIPYASSIVTLGPGDCVLLITDGITESKDKDERDFHMEGVATALRAGPMNPRAMVDRLMTAVHQHASGRKPHDDLTVVVFGRVATGGSSGTNHHRSLPGG